MIRGLLATAGLLGRLTATASNGSNARRVRWRGRDGQWHWAAV